MKYFFVILIFMLFSFSAFSQNNIKYFPVTHNIITKADGTEGQDPIHIPDIMRELNKAFLPAGIQFYMSCAGIDAII